MPPYANRFKIKIIRNSHKGGHLMLNQGRYWFYRLYSASKYFRNQGLHEDIQLHPKFHMFSIKKFPIVPYLCYFNLHFVHLQEDILFLLCSIIFYRNIFFIFFPPNLGTQQPKPIENIPNQIPQYFHPTPTTTNHLI